MRPLRSALLAFTLLGSHSLFADSPSTPRGDLSELRPHDLAIVEIPAVGTAAPGRFHDLFRPFRTEAAALSPDGKRLAYSVREGGDLYVLTFDIDNPARPLAKILAGSTRTSTPFLEPDLREKTPARIRWMGWATDNRLVIETNASLTLGFSANASGGIFAINADGTNPRTLVTPRDILPPDYPLNFSPLAPASQYTYSRASSSFLIPTPDFSPAPREFGEHLTAFDRDLASMNRDNDLPLDIRPPNSPTVFDYASDDPDWIIVRANHPKNYGLYRVNIHSGKLRFGPTESVSGELATLLNRQGLVGSSVPNTRRTAFPHAYLTPKSTALSLGRWASLSTIANAATDAPFSVSPENFFGHRAFPVGFDENPNILYYASNTGRDTYGIYGLNLKTGERAGHTLESSDFDLASPAPEGFASPGPLVFDRYTRQLAGVRYQSIARSAIWIRPELRDIQGSLEHTFPGRSVDILEWDRAANRFLALVRGPTEPGSFYIIDRDKRRAQEFVRRSDLPAESEPRFKHYFSIDNPAGGQLTGFIVIPNAVRQKPIPLVVMCAEDPWQQAPAEFDGEINALAQMGFAVLQVNPRGTWGFGAKHRDTAGESFDKAQSVDILASIDALAKTLPIHPGRVAIMGRSRGGFLALRAAQLHPDRFRCVVALDPTVNLSNWINYTRWTTGDSAPALTRSFFGTELIQSNPLMDDSTPHKRPAFILSYRGSEGGSPTQMYLDARTLARAIENDGTIARFQTLSLDYMRRMPEARSNAMRHIEDFLNLNIYNYDVQMGDTKVTTTW